MPRVPTCIDLFFRIFIFVGRLVGGLVFEFDFYVLLMGNKNEIMCATDCGSSGGGNNGYSKSLLRLFCGFVRPFAFRVTWSPPDENPTDKKCTHSPPTPPTQHWKHLRILVSEPQNI